MNLVLLIALVGSPVNGSFEACDASGYCETMEMPFSNLMVCMIGGQQAEAEWIASRPGFVPRGGWRCAPMSERKA
jgi:hypothetical protein